MTFLIVSALGESVGLAIRLLGEGHKVLYYIHAPSEKDVGDGFLEKVDDWRAHLQEADLVFFDDCTQEIEGAEPYESGKWFLEVKKEFPDKLVIGGPPDVARLENDRMFANEMMQKYGIPTVRMERFTSFQDAKSFVEKEQGAWALKHNAQVDRDLAHVSFEPDDMIEFLEWLDKNWKDLAPGKSPDFVLQEAVKGVEFAVTTFFDGQRFRSEACYLNQEEKKLLDGGNGPSTGQMGEIGLSVPNARLFRETLAKIEPFLKEQGYVGWADMNCIVTGPDSLVPLEFTIGRPGYPTLYSWCEMLEEPVGDFLARMAKADPEPVKMSDAVNCTLVLATGTFPNQHPTRNKLAIVHGLDKTGLRHVWLGEVGVEDGKIYGAGDMGYIAVVTAKDDTIPLAVRKAYDTMDKLDVVPYAIRRMDIGKRAMEELPQIAQWGWLQ